MTSMPSFTDSPIWLLYLFYAMGQAVYIFHRASEARRKKQVETRQAYVELYGDILLLRALGALLLFACALYLPEFAGFSFRVPRRPLLALGGGAFVDAILDWGAQKIPAISKHIPKLPNGEGS